VIAFAFIAGVGMRVVWLNKMPPALYQDEACSGYDAFSILQTGRDHHGNFMPLVMQGFNDFRMPLFTYSLVPLVAAFGLKTTVVRLAAVIWGIIDLAAVTLIAGLSLGWGGAAAAALIGALMPWHIELSRFGIEATAGSATVSLAVASFFLWMRGHRNVWLLLCCAFFGLSFYTYSITKVSVPLLAALLAVLYWRELARVRLMTALGAVAIGLVLVIPQGVLLLRYGHALQARFQAISLFNPAVLCSRCGVFETAITAQTRPRLLAANFASYFTPSFLFLKGDVGDHWTMLHPPRFGELLPEQALLVLLALLALFSRRRRKVVLLVLGWLVIAAIPATLVLPLGAGFPDPHPMPTPWVILNYHPVTFHITPSMLLSHPDLRHDSLAMAPWILLSALGFVVLLDLTGRRSIFRGVLVGLLFAGVLFDAGRYTHDYFVNFPTVAAPYFQYGIEEFVQEINQRYSQALPVIITSSINQPYIYVLFFEKYPPAAFQKGPVIRLRGLFAPILRFDRYVFVPPAIGYSRLAHGIFVYRGNDQIPKPPELMVRYPDGNVAYQVVVK
jgi:MYXO-CTERM domain-containing protein